LYKGREKKQRGYINGGVMPTKSADTNPLANTKWENRFTEIEYKNGEKIEKECYITAVFGEASFKLKIFADTYLGICKISKDSAKLSFSNSNIKGMAVLIGDELTISISKKDDYNKVWRESKYTLTRLEELNHNRGFLVL
jgi:hypothetical protein